MGFSGTVVMYTKRTPTHFYIDFLSGSLQVAILLLKDKIALQFPALILSAAFKVDAKVSVSLMVIQTKTYSIVSWC